MEKARQMMARYFGYKDFKRGQAEVISAILKKQDVLGIMPTGGGKSLCYQLPALQLEGITLVISPLIALMKDQVDGLLTQEIPATFINSSLSPGEISRRLEMARTGRVKILYLAPERLKTEDFSHSLEQVDLSLVAIDEAHCISQWGHEFRPSYLKIKSWLDKLPRRPVIAAFTATATIRVQQDIIDHLGLQQPRLVINSFDRKNLYFSVQKGVDRLQFILDYLERHPEKSGIIYAATRKEVETLYDKLKKAGCAAARYHAGMNNSERSGNQDDFIYDRARVMVATNAFGMGIDKSNIAFVIHHNMPRHLEAYYQEAGRAGRDGQPADCILLYQAGDIQLQKFLIENAPLYSRYRESEYEKLHHMVDYCHSAHCLRKTILDYFGEEGTADECDSCANCREQELVDITLEAQKIFSCIVRMKKGYGSKLIAGVLKGSRQYRVVSLGFDLLSTFGIMKEQNLGQIVEYINILAAEGYLQISSGRYPVVSLTTRVPPVLRGEEKVFIRREKEKVEAAPDERLFCELQKLRRDIAARLEVPPYVVFSDKTLREMARQLPRSAAALLTISGIGEIKCARYGDDFLQLIERYVEGETGLGSTDRDGGSGQK